MKISLKRYKRIITALALAALAICLSLIVVACTSAQAQSSPLSISERIGDDRIEETTPLTSAEENYSRWLHDKYSSTVSGRAGWLRDMMIALDMISPAVRENDYNGIFKAAYENGVTDTLETGAYTALTREYAARTIVNALGYEPREISPVADAVFGDDIMTLAYYGYILPDEDNRLYPDAVVTAEERDSLISELDRYMSLRSKRVLAFGDSIMYGAGNCGSGIADIIGEKYGMTVSDYSVSGAAFGRYKERSHIADQIRESLSADEAPDIILLDGATNDMMVNIDAGTMTKDYSFDSINEVTFAGGMEYALALLNRYYEDVPVLYIRAHNMEFGGDIAEVRYGEYALEIAAKWDVKSVDLYSDTDFNAENVEIREKYTSYKEKLGRADSIHPTALGYAKFYLPLISDSAIDLIG